MDERGYRQYINNKCHPKWQPTWAEEEHQHRHYHQTTETHIHLGQVYEYCSTEVECFVELLVLDVRHLRIKLYWQMPECKGSIAK